MKVCLSIMNRGLIGFLTALGSVLMSISAAANDSFNAVVVEGVAMISSATHKIPDFAFEDFEDIREVVFESPSHCREIGDFAFLGCSNLRSIELPATIRKIGEGAFRECVSLEHVNLPAGVEVIPSCCFYRCESLKSVAIPESVTDIKNFAFIYCKSLDDVFLPPNVTHIGNNAFSCCSSLRQIEVPSSVTELESYAFSDCESLVAALLPANHNMLGELIFSGCRSLMIIYEPSPVPPVFDCKSYIFEPDDAAAYERCTLRVPAGSEENYRNAEGWHLFKHIENDRD